MALSKGFTTSRSLLEAIRDTANDQAWREFLALYEPMILSWCKRSGLRPSDAEEVCADVLAKLVLVMRGFPYDPERRFRGWLKTVVTHAVADFWRHRRRQPPTVSLSDPTARTFLESSTLPPGFDEVAGAVGEAVERGLRIVEIVQRQVQPDAWQAFWLTTVKGEKAREVGEKLGMTVAAVYTAKYRVAKLLRAESNNATPPKCVVTLDGGPR